MNRKQIYILILAVIGFLSCILFNFWDVMHLLFFSNQATVAAMVDLRPMLAELVVMAIIFGILFMKFKTPKKKG